jgi:putative transposase
MPGQIRAVVHRVTPGKLRSIRLMKARTGKYFAACLYEDETEPPTPPHVVRDVIGVDVGLAHVAIESTGRKTENPKFLKRAQRNLRR